MHPVLRPSATLATLKERPWGGRRLERLYADVLQAQPQAKERRHPIGESWEFSTLPGSTSRCEGQGLDQVLGRPLPLLVKLIDTARALSVQLHPDDGVTGPGEPGKEESWVVLDASPGATIAVGLRPGIGRRELEAAAHAALHDPSQGPRLLSMISQVPVRRGTVVVVPAGTIHAIGGGILLAEIQQPSDCTYRVFDYGSQRETHLEEALANLVPEARPYVWQPGRDPGATLRSKHLELQVLDAGEHQLGPALRDEVLVVVNEEADLRAPGYAEALSPGALRLRPAGAPPLALRSAGQCVIAQRAGP